MVVGGGWLWVVVIGGPWRPRETTEASSCAQILARYPKSSPLPTPPGPLKLRLFGEKEGITGYGIRGCFSDEGCFSDVRGPFRNKSPKMISKNISYDNCSHFWVVFSFFLSKYVEHIFKICSHIQKSTQNPNIIFKITIYCTKYPPKCQNTFEQNLISFRTFRKYKFSNFCIFIFIYIYMYIYIYIYTRTRVGPLHV